MANNCHNIHSLLPSFFILSSKTCLNKIIRHTGVCATCATNPTPVAHLPTHLINWSMALKGIDKQIHHKNTTLLPISTKAVDMYTARKGKLLDNPILCAYAIDSDWDRREHVSHREVHLSEGEWSPIRFLLSDFRHTRSWSPTYLLVITINISCSSVFAQTTDIILRILDPLSRDRLDCYRVKTVSEPTITSHRYCVDRRNDDLPLMVALLGLHKVCVLVVVKWSVISRLMNMLTVRVDGHNFIKSPDNLLSEVRR